MAPNKTARRWFERGRDAACGVYDLGALAAGRRAFVLLPLLVAAPSCGNDSGDDDSPDSGSGGSEASAGSNTTGGVSGMTPRTAGAGGAGKGGAMQGRGGSAAGGASKSSGGAANVAGRAGASGSGGAGAPGGGQSRAAQVARKLGRAPNFLIGMGNDLPEDYDWDAAPVFSLPHALDIHYYYLSSGWQTWNDGGRFPIILGQVDVEKRVTPMVSYYGMAASGEGNLGTLTNANYMGDYWENLKLLFERYGNDLDEPAIVHLEPDFWAFAQRQTGGNPASQDTILHPECSELPSDLTGMGRCIVKLARTYAPKLVVGFHASGWAAENGTQVGNFLERIGGSEADVVVIDMLDRDAGCFEAGELEQCQRDGDFYWDETNQTSPNFHEHLAWAKDVSAAMGVPILWWQLPFGVPSNTPGGEPGRYRDNRVKYLFEHVQEFVDAGGVGACFGVGSAGQTFVTTDGGQFANAIKNYYQSPVSLP